MLCVLLSITCQLSDPPNGAEDWIPPADGFSYGSDLVEHIRDKYGDYFVIGVAGYPTGHPDATSYQDDIRHLKSKVCVRCGSVYRVWRCVTTKVCVWRCVITKVCVELCHN